MLDLRISPEKIGDSDSEHGIRHAAFHSHAKNGGTVTPAGRIILDSGVMNPDLLAGEAAKVWAKSGLKSRMQAIIAHELAEHETGSHEAALQSAPQTRLPIDEGATRREQTVSARSRSDRASAGLPILESTPARSWSAVARCSWNSVLPGSAAMSRSPMELASR